MSGVNGPLVILDHVKVSGIHYCSLAEWVQYIVTLTVAIVTLSVAIELKDVARLLLFCSLNAFVIVSVSSGTSC